MTLTYQKVSYTDTESDLDQIIEIINETYLTKSEIEKKLVNHTFYEHLGFKTGTIFFIKDSINIQ